MESDNQNLLIEGIERMGLPVLAGQLAALATYHDALLLTNAAGLNLTGIRDERESTIRNLLDSLAGWIHVGDPEIIDDERMRLVEIGSGAGLPGIPLGIVLPFREIVLVESKEKKAAFLRDVTDVLNELIAPRRFVVARADANQLPVPRRFERLVARAFGPLKDLFRFVDRFVAWNGRGVAYKGRRETIDAELAELSEVQQRRCEVEPIEVPFLDAVERHIVRLAPHSKTPREDVS